MGIYHNSRSRTQGKSKLEITIRTTCYVLFFLKIGSREVHIAGVRKQPKERWMEHLARNVTLEEWGFLRGQRYLIFDRGSKFCSRRVKERRP